MRDAVASGGRRAELRDLVAELEPLRVRFELDGVDPRGIDVRFEPQKGPRLDERGGPAEVVISGSIGAWLEVLSGDVPYVRQVNVAHGRFSVQGSAVHLSWLMPVLSEMLSPEWRPAGAISLRAAPAVGVISGRYVESSDSQVYLETTGSGPAVILLHTAGRDARQWHPVMARLAAKFTLYAPDLPGRGRSEPVAGDGGYLDEVADIASWIRGLADSLGLESYLIAGCSLGGNLALLLGASDPRVRGVLALQGADCTPTISAGSLAMMDHPRVSLPHSNINFSMSLIGKDTDADAREAIRRGVRTINAPAQRADLTAYAGCDIRALMPKVTCPVVLFRGEDDWIVDEDMVRATASRLVNAAEVRVIGAPGVGHFPHVERPELVAEMLCELHGAG